MRTAGFALNEGRLGRAGNSHRGTDVAPRCKVQERSTKAGSAEPATLDGRRCGPPSLTTLNEGRLGLAGNSAVNEGRLVAHPRRSTKAGSAEPATLNEDVEVAVSRWSALNEGRLGRAGNSGRFTRHRRAGRHLSRSTKAGSAEPATRVCCRLAKLGLIGRSSAQRRPARPSRQLLFDQPIDLLDCPRSTKAGSAEPATRIILNERRKHVQALNEGRLGRAGNSDRPVGCNPDD